MGCPEVIQVVGLPPSEFWAFSQASFFNQASFFFFD